MKVVRAVAGSAPFILFALLTPVLDPGWAATAGFAVAVVVMAASARGGVKILPAVQAVVLAVLAVCDFASGAHVHSALGRYGPAIAALALGSFMIASAPVMPFTVQFSRSSVPREFWHDPRFLAVNRRISIAWGVAVLMLGLCAVAGSAISAAGGPTALRFTLRWAVPVLLIWLAIAYTRRTAGAAEQQVAAARQAAGTQQRSAP